ncbi:hypothetical protein BDV24DRAFT_164256 [Aspergillus arachidicola]|uniref:Uncharacterized protein n=1 Tax=Aspergillus arachidicola TaxID=656916 RepID=A0A2G7FT33_9EURO|nr:hypothetical protein BDV24DRAFT_164256 [Aspergillus arachidicola]PIG83699.1 hypothetical protein AARAC_010631 [Aspergillus arachidicola]
MKFSTILVATTALLTGANAVPRLVEVHSSEICWRVCFPEKPHCPHGWHDKEFGHCYTCCKDEHHDDSVVDKLDMFWQA